MSAIIYYFSSTGNSLEIARRVAGELEDCTIRSMDHGQPDGPVGGPGESIGFVFPVFFGGLPRLVKRFVQRLEIRPGTYCFALTNCTMIGADTLGMLEDILKEKGIGLSYADQVKMPGNCIFEYSGPSPDKVRKILAKAMDKVDEAAKAIAHGARRPVKRKAIPVLWTKTYNPVLYKNIAGWDEKFAVTGACTGCGLCARVCPAGNIRIEDRHPVWQHSCERCVRCIQWCPAEAVQYGKKTAGRRRYRNPNVRVKDIAKDTIERPAPENR